MDILDLFPLSVLNYDNISCSSAVLVAAAAQTGHTGAGLRDSGSVVFI